MKIFLIQPAAEASFSAPPLGLQLIATALSQAGRGPIYDVDPNKGDDPYGLDYTGSDVIVGLTVTFMTIGEAFRLAAHVKQQNPAARVCFGGPQPTLMPEESIADDAVDLVVIGEGTETMCEVVERLATGADLEGVRGVWFKRSGTVVRNEPRPFIEDLDTLPLADKSFFCEAAYHRQQLPLLAQLVRPVVWHVITTQSCPYGCKMCQPALKTIAGPWRQRSVASVIAEIRRLKAERNARHFSFADNDMGIDRRWLSDFCREAQQIDGITMSCLGRANLLDHDMLARMKDAGFSAISYGAESGSNRVLREVMNKRITVEQIISFAESCFELGIRTYSYWMMANPGETVEEMRRTIDLAADLPVFHAHFHVATPNPGTQYYLDAVAGGYLEMAGWTDVNDRSRPTLLKDGVSRQDIIAVDRYLIETMTSRGWNHHRNGHTLSFINARLFAKREPLRVFGNEVRLLLGDRHPRHIRNIIRSAGYVVAPSP